MKSLLNFNQGAALEPKEERKYLLKGAQLLSTNVLTFVSSLLALGVMNEFGAYFKVAFLSWLVLFNKTVLIEIGLAALFLRFVVFYVAKATKQHFRTEEELFNHDEINEAIKKNQDANNKADNKEVLNALKYIERDVIRNSLSLAGTTGVIGTRISNAKVALNVMKAFNKRFKDFRLVVQYVEYSNYFRPCMFWIVKKENYYNKFRDFWETGNYEYVNGEEATETEKKDRDMTGFGD